jgi:hypothetical protein
MASNDTELQDEIVSFGQYEPEELSADDLQTVIERAKRHLEVEADFSPDSWYDERIHEEALFWTAMLFSKVATAELDARAVSVGAIEEGELLAADGEATTTWYRNYSESVSRLAEEENVPSYGVVRTSRTSDDDGKRNYRRD